MCYLWYSNWFKIETTLEANSEAYSEPFQTSKMDAHVDTLFRDDFSDFEGFLISSSMIMSIS